MKKTETENFKTSKNPAGAFASQYVASRLDLQTGQEFPMDIWQKTVSYTHLTLPTLYSV